MSSCPLQDKKNVFQNMTIWQHLLSDAVSTLALAADSSLMISRFLSAKKIEGRLLVMHG